MRRPLIDLAEHAAVTARLDGMVRRYTRELAGVAEVRVEYVPGIGSQVVTLVPSRPGAVAVDWIDGGGDLQVDVHSAGGGGSTDAIDHSLEGVDFVESVVEAVVAGRARELQVTGRSRVELRTVHGDVFDGETAHKGWLGLVPLPGWPARARVTDFLPYRAD